MFTRPRCRKFEPLATSQLRLRNLIKVSGVNFEGDCDDKSDFLYFTLHLSAFSKPFYTSEKVEYRSKIEWPEINCQQLDTCGQKFLCVRVWRKRSDNRTKIQPSSSTDEMLFLWGVYFSGLECVVGGEHFKSNTLLFHLSGGTFTSSEQILNETVCDQKTYSTSSNSSVTNSSSSRPSPESLPRSVKSESVTESKQQRYIKLDFPKNEVQPSYTLDCLLRLQDIQRRIRLKQESSKMLAERICTKSAACLDLDLIVAKPVFYEPQKQPGMGRTLSRLLATQEAPPKPETILKIHELRKKVECARFRIKLLTQQRDRTRYSNRSLEKRREKLKDENTEKESVIWNSLRMLSRENPKCYEEKLVPQRDVLANVRLALNETKRTLLRELNEIYHIAKNEGGLFTVNRIYLPDAEAYADARASSPTEISIALGQVAHAVLIISRILNIPLRNPIRHEGSRSKIIDSIKILPPTDRIFPLFCRVVPPPNVLLYGVYLLNQNISQLKHILGIRKGDLRATLANLLDLMTSTDFEDDFSRRFPKNFAAKHADNSMSSVESVPLNMIINVPTLLGSLSPRVSRSLDNFDDLIDTFNTSFNSSAPSLISPS